MGSCHIDVLDDKMGLQASPDGDDVQLYATNWQLCREILT